MANGNKLTGYTPQNAPQPKSGPGTPRTVGVRGGQGRNYQPPPPAGPRAPGRPAPLGRIPGGGSGTPLPVPPAGTPGGIDASAGGRGAGYNPTPPPMRPGIRPDARPLPLGQVPVPAPKPTPLWSRYGLYGQQFDPNVARDIQQYRQQTEGMDPRQRALQLNTHMQKAMRGGRFSAKAKKEYQALVGAVNRGDISYGDALERVNDFVAKYASPRAGGPTRVKSKIGKTGPKKASAQLFAKGGPVKKKASAKKATPKKAAPSRAKAAPSRKKAAATKAVGRKAAPKLAKKAAVGNRVGGRANQGRLKKAAPRKRK